MDTIQQSLQQMMTSFHQRLDSIEVQLPSPTSRSPDGLSAEFASFKAFVVTTFRSVQQQISILAQQVDGIEMRSRRKMLLVHGLPEEKDEKTGELLVKVIAERLKIASFSLSDINRCHRMGRFAADRARPVVFKLKDMSLRDKIWMAKSGLKDSGITLAEFLTKTRHDLFLAARRRFGIKKCWTRDGSIFVSGPDGTRHRINSMEDLTTIQAPQSSSLNSPTPHMKGSRTVVSPQVSSVAAQGTASRPAPVVSKDSKTVRSRRDLKPK